jgi:hypothetical protein
MASLESKKCSLLYIVAINVLPISFLGISLTIYYILGRNASVA